MFAAWVGTYTFDEFCRSCPNGHDSPGGRNFLIVFNTAQTVRIAGTADGRQWFGSILAPFAEVVVEGSAGFVDGQIVAKSYREEGGLPGSLQVHGHCFRGATTCAPGSDCPTTGTAATGSTVVSEPTATSCADFWSTKKCRRKTRKNKCHKRKVSKRCSASCGVCAIG
mmetsp:Transcript_19338/g.52302  ORF Transcript_19338/g.52302 Transcript_19338/m.52302 type:complete len:168 (-) Transcript_19338:326-829(-)